MSELRALSLTQPWAWIILHLGKRIENRSRNIGNYRGPVLLHAALRCTTGDWWSASEFVRERFGECAAGKIPHPGDLTLGAIVGRAVVVDQCRPGLEGRAIDRAGDWALFSDWYMGAHAYLLDEVTELEPIPCKGALGFWRVPLDVLARAHG